MSHLEAQQQPPPLLQAPTFLLRYQHVCSSLFPLPHLIPPLPSASLSLIQYPGVGHQCPPGYQGDSFIPNSSPAKAFVHVKGCHRLSQTQGLDPGGLEPLLCSPAPCTSTGVENSLGKVFLHREQGGRNGSRGGLKNGIYKGREKCVDGR